MTQTGLITRRVLKEKLAQRFTALLALLFAILVLARFTPMDETVQDFLHSPENGWMVGKDDSVPKLFFYDGPKGILIVLCLALVFFLFRRPGRTAEWFRPGRAPILTALAVFLATILSVAAAKALTGCHCPWSSDRYGGPVPHHRLFEKPPAGESKIKGKCFPAGHASGGFGLIGLIWAVRGARRRRIVFGLALALGTWMGAYQMAKGAHYLSHTLVTALWACLLCWTLGSIWSLKKTKSAGLRRSVLGPSHKNT